MAIIVNGERIEEASIAAETQRIEEARQAGCLADDDVLTAARELARDRLVGEVLLRQEARRKIELADEEIDREFRRLIDSCGGVQAFRQRYRIAENDDERFKKHLAEGLRMDKLIADAAGGQTVDEMDMSQYYASHLDDFMAPEEIRVSHVVRNPRNAPPDEVYRQMCEARKALRAGAEFATVAEKYSECHSEPGGDLGFFAKGRMVEAFEAIVFSLEVGEVSPVFMTQFGFHVAKLVDRRGPRRRAFQEVRQAIGERIREERRQATAKKLVARLTLNATIKDAAETVGPGKGRGGKKGGKKH